MRMKIINISKITGLVCISVIVIMTNLSFTIGNEITSPPECLSKQAIQVSNFSKPGYKPVSDTCTYVKNGVQLNDNFLYKEWCEETFDNGNYIYEAYKNIAFNIKYTPEPKSTDFWQTPLDTTRLKKGDCEDIVFNFFSKLPPDQKNAEIVWGWVIDKQREVGTAHVWYQLTDKKWQKYIVEGFSNDWNGIIPMWIVEDTETRKPILTMSHCMLNKLSHLLPDVEDWNICQTLVALFQSKGFISHVPSHQLFLQDMSIQLHFSDFEYIEYPESTQHKSRQYAQFLDGSPGQTLNLNIDKNICDILKKLRDVFSRYEYQKESCQAKHTSLS